MFSVVGLMPLVKPFYLLGSDYVFPRTANKLIQAQLKPHGSREAQGSAGRIQVTAVTYEYLKDKYLFEKRDATIIKGKGKMITYWLKGRKLGDL